MFPVIRNRKFFIQCVCIFFIISVTIIWFKPDVIPTRRGNTKEYSFDVLKLKSKPEYLDTCFDSKLDLSIGSLGPNLQTWSQAIDRHCQILWGKFQNMYSVSVRRGLLHFPSKFKHKVLGWLGNNNELMKQMYNQTVYHVRNVYTLEHTVYNPLRSLRPGSVSHINPRVYVQDLAQKTNSSCDFCNYKEMTAEDVFERIESKFSVTAANTFKIDKWHGLFLTRKHNPLDLKEEDILDLFNTSLKWFQTVHKIDPLTKYPVIIWDNLPHAGASQLHPHLHGMFDPSQYYGAIHIQYEAAKKYALYTGNEYWEDFIEIHHALGLTVKFKSAIAIAPLTSKKDHEIIILSNSPTAEVFQLLFYVIKTFNEKLNIYCFSCGIGLPDIEKFDPLHPVIIRIGTRGDCNSVRSDISSLELYSVNNVNADPYAMISHLRETLKYIQRMQINKVMPSLVLWP
jgi:hypothetical protein